MYNEEFRRFAISKGLDGGFFEIPKQTLEDGVQLQLNMFRTRLDYGDKTGVVVYARKPIEDVLILLRERMSDLFPTVSFSYKDLRGKNKSSGGITRSLADHFFESEETNLDKPTLFLYYGFEKILDEATQLMAGEHVEDQTLLNELTNFLDVSCGRNWSENALGYEDNPRFKKIKADESNIRCGLVFSMEEKVAINWFNAHRTSCTRSHIGRDFPVHYIF